MSGADRYVDGRSDTVHIEGAPQARDFRGTLKESPRVGRRRGRAGVKSPAYRSTRELAQSGLKAHSLQSAQNAVENLTLHQFAERVALPPCGVRQRQERFRRQGVATREGVQQMASLVQLFGHVAQQGVVSADLTPQNGFDLIRLLRVEVSGPSSKRSAGLRPRRNGQQGAAEHKTGL